MLLSDDSFNVPDHWSAVQLTSCCTGFHGYVSGSIITDMACCIILTLCFVHWLRGTAQNVCPGNSFIMDYHHNLFPICHQSRGRGFRQADNQFSLCKLAHQSLGPRMQAIYLFSVKHSPQVIWLCTLVKVENASRSKLNMI